MVNKIIVPFDDQEGGVYELNVDLDRLSKGEISNAIIGIGRTKEQSTFVGKINKAKKPGEVPSSNRDVQINYGKGLDYIWYKTFKRSSRIFKSIYFSFEKNKAKCKRK